MPYVTIENFSAGVDRSSDRAVSTPGTLWEGKNGHLTRGGRFEKRKAFVGRYSLPTGKTKGLTRTVDGLYVFGADAAASLSIPAGVNYQRLQHPTIPTLQISKILSSDLYNGKIYAIAQFENGDIRHYYDGTNVADWNVGGTKPTGYGTLVLTHRRKLYSPVGSVVYFPVIDTATNWDTSAGAGFQNMNTNQGGSDSVTGMCKYQDKIVFLSRTTVQVWNMADSAANNAESQTINETGTRAPRSCRGFGDLDAFYLSDSGIRSLRARNYTNTAGVNDVGTPIDPLVLEWVDSVDDGSTVEAAVSITEPREGRFWLAIGTRIFVFSYFPSKKISAWSYYDVGMTFTDFATYSGRVYARSGDSIYLYGGTDNDSYGSDYEVVAGLPFISASKVATFKQWKGMDVASQGSWNCTLLIDPNNENNYVTVGEMAGVTFSEESIAAVGHATHVAPVFTHQGEGYASLSLVALEFDGAEAKG